MNTDKLEEKLRKILELYEKYFLKILEHSFKPLFQIIEPIDRATAKILYKTTGIKLQILRENN